MQRRFKAKGKWVTFTTAKDRARNRRKKKKKRMPPRRKDGTFRKR